MVPGYDALDQIRRGHECCRCQTLASQHPSSRSYKRLSCGQTGFDLEDLMITAYFCE